MVSPDYYTTTGRKVGDFLIGFFGVWVLAAIFTWIITLTIGLMTGGVSTFLSVLLYIIPLVILISGVSISFKKNRRYIGIGAIATILITLLVFGACVAIFSISL